MKKIGVAYGDTRLAVLPLVLAGLSIPAIAPSVRAQTYPLVRRIMAASDRQDIADAQTMGFQAFLNQQLNYTQLANVEGTVLANWRSVFAPPLSIRDGVNGGQLTEAESRSNMRSARTWRWVYSDQQFYERMTWFWANHFNIHQRKRVGWYLFPYFDRVVNRQHAFGVFRDIAHASAGDNADRATAMLLYLDNLANNSNGPQDVPQENYAREILELHLMGTDPQAYSETDVRVLARMFTGWNIDTTNNPQDFGMLWFNGANHWHQTDTFLGLQIAGDDLTQSEASTAIDRAIDYRRAGIRFCARFIARKLVSAFLTDAAPTTALQQAALDRAVNDATVAFGTDGDIVAMLRAILTQQNLADILSGPTPLTKYMSPWQFYSTLLRASGASIDPAQIETLTFRLDALGQEPYGFSPPIGYPDDIAVWVQDQPGRWAFAVDLFRNQITGVTVNVNSLYTPLGGFDVTTAGADVDEILTGGNLDAEDVRILQLYADASLAAGDPPNVIAANTLILGSLAPSFNRY